eukprot:231069_1
MNPYIQTSAMPPFGHRPVFPPGYNPYALPPIRNGPYIQPGPHSGPQITGGNVFHHGPAPPMASRGGIERGRPAVRARRGGPTLARGRGRGQVVPGQGRGQRPIVRGRRKNRGGSPANRGGNMRGRGGGRGRGSYPASSPSRSGAQINGVKPASPVGVKSMPVSSAGVITLTGVSKKRKPSSRPTAPAPKVARRGTPINSPSNSASPGGMVSNVARLSKVNNVKKILDSDLGKDEVKIDQKMKSDDLYKLLCDYLKIKLPSLTSVSRVHVVTLSCLTSLARFPACLGGLIAKDLGPALVTQLRGSLRLQVLRFLKAAFGTKQLRLYTVLLRAQLFQRLGRECLVKCESQDDITAAELCLQVLVLVGQRRQWGMPYLSVLDGAGLTQKLKDFKPGTKINKNSAASVSKSVKRFLTCINTPQKARECVKLLEQDSYSHEDMHLLEKCLSFDVELYHTSLLDVFTKIYESDPKNVLSYLSSNTTFLDRLLGFITRPTHSDAARIGVRATAWRTLLAIIKSRTAIKSTASTSTASTSTASTSTASTSTASTSSASASVASTSAASTSISSPSNSSDSDSPESEVTVGFLILRCLDALQRMLAPKGSEQVQAIAFLDMLADTLGCHALLGAHSITLALFGRTLLDSAGTPADRTKARRCFFKLLSQAPMCKQMESMIVPVKQLAASSQYTAVELKSTITFVETICSKEEIDDCLPYDDRLKLLVSSNLWFFMLKKMKSIWSTLPIETLKSMLATAHILYGIDRTTLSHLLPWCETVLSGCGRPGGALTNRQQMVMAFAKHMFDEGGETRTLLKTYRIVSHLVRTGQVTDEENRKAVEEALSAVLAIGVSSKRQQVVAANSSSSEAPICTKELPSIAEGIVSEDFEVRIQNLDRLVKYFETGLEKSKDMPPYPYIS